MLPVKSSELIFKASIFCIYNTEFLSFSTCESSFTSLVHSEGVLTRNLSELAFYSTLLSEITLLGLLPPYQSKLRGHWRHSRRWECYSATCHSISRSTDHSTSHQVCSLLLSGVSHLASGFYSVEFYNHIFPLQVSPCLNVLSWLLFVSDTDVLADACWALSYLSDGPNDKIQAVIDAGVCRRLVELLM